MSRNLADELESDRRRREHELLTMLRDAVLEARRRVRVANANGKLSSEERESITLTFDGEGMGPFVTISLGTLLTLGQIAERAKEAE